MISNSPGVWSDDCYRVCMLSHLLYLTIYILFFCVYVHNNEQQMTVLGEGRWSKSQFECGCLKRVSVREKRACPFRTCSRKSRAKNRTEKEKRRAPEICSFFAEVIVGGPAGPGGPGFSGRGRRCGQAASSPRRRGRTSGPSASARHHNQTHTSKTKNEWLLSR